jgi:GH35 family endo-1,4-beta-xylanase
VPIHGVAKQCHIPIEYYQNMAYYSTIIDKFGNLGLEFHITECTIEINQAGKGKSAEKLQKQADNWPKFCNSA